mgnify:FL=1
MLWSPDTCKCVVEVEVDEESGTWVFSSSIRADEYHRPLMGQKAHLTVLLAENRARNVALGLLIGLIGLIRLVGEGEPLGMAEADYQGYCSFGPDGVLLMNLSGHLSRRQMGKLQRLCDSHVGIGRVLVT